MKVYIERIPEEGLLLEGEESPRIIDIGPSEERFKENIHISLKAYKITGKLIVGGVVWTDVVLICSLCSESFTYLIENKGFSYDCELEGRDIIDLTEPIREDILIGLPITPLCQKDCKGLCVECGKNLNFGKCGCLEKRVLKGPLGKLGDLF